MTKQLSKKQKHLNELAWMQIRGALMLMSGLASLGGAIWGWQGAIAGLCIGRALAPLNHLANWSDE